MIRQGAGPVMNDLVSRLGHWTRARFPTRLTPTACRARSAGCGRSPRSGRPGRAVTVLLGAPAAAPAPSPGAPKRHLSTAAVDASGAGDVIVVAHQGRTDCAGWGGLLSRAAVIRGIDGVVVDGVARDLAEAAAVGLPVFASGSTSVTARGRAVEVCWGEPVEFAGVRVAPGDLVLADGAASSSSRRRTRKRSSPPLSGSPQPRPRWRPCSTREDPYPRSWAPPTRS